MKTGLYFVYILTNSHHNVLYTGITNDLERRCLEHKNKKVKGFTSKYNLDRLIYFEEFEYVNSAIAREKQIKAYSRVKKDKLIDAFNPEWEDLFGDDKIKLPGKQKSKV